MPIYLYNKVVWLISEVRTSFITCTGQISVTRSRVRYADVSWKEGKTPIVYLCDSNFGFAFNSTLFVQSCRSTNSIFSNVSRSNSCKLYFFRLPSHLNRIHLLV